MCKSQAEGGQRCAAHTRPRYRAASIGTPEWDEAAAAYASTKTGRAELEAYRLGAALRGDTRETVAFEHALRAGAHRREATAAICTELGISSGQATLRPSAWNGNQYTAPDGTVHTHEPINPFIYDRERGGNWRVLAVYNNARDMPHSRHAGLISDGNDTMFSYDGTGRCAIYVRVGSVATQNIPDIPYFSPSSRSGDRTPQRG